MVKVASGVRTLSPGSAQADRHIVLDKRGGDTITIHLGSTDSKPACWSISVDSHAGSDKKSCSRKRKREKRKKKKSRRCYSSSESRLIQCGQWAERPADRETVDEARPIHDSVELTEAVYMTETHYLSQDRPLESATREKTSPVRHSVPMEVEPEVGATSTG